MQKSLIIARLVGPVLSAIGIGMLVNQPSYREMAVQFRRRPSLHLFFRNSGAGRRALHPQCPQCVGTFRIIAPQFSSFVAGAIVANSGFFVGAGIVLLGLGGFITFKGYMA